MKILAVDAVPGLAFSFGGKHHPGSQWKAEQHGQDIKVEERPNGDVWFTGPDGKCHRYGKHMIARILTDGKDEPATVQGGGKKP